MFAKDLPHPQLLDSKTYLADLTQSVSEAKIRVNLVSLILADDTYTHALINALINAANRGLTVTLAADTFTYGEFGGYFSPLQRLAPRSKAVTEMVSRLRAAGASFTWLGSTFKLNPFGGVTHLKWAIVDDTSYCFGGVNLYEVGIKSTDYMFKFSDPMLAEQISEQHLAIAMTSTLQGAYPGYVSEGNYGMMYIDSGKRHESVIYTRLLKLAQQASHVLVVTQYCPSGPLVRYLKNKSDVYYNQPSRTPYPAKILIAYDEIRTGLRSQYEHVPYLHAKFMVFTMQDGRKIAMTGSHNFSYSGVMFGTREVALETTDSNIIQQLEQFHHEYVA